MGIFWPEMYRRNMIPIYIIVSMVESVSLSVVSVKVVVFRNLTTTLMGGVTTLMEELVHMS